MDQKRINEQNVLLRILRLLAEEHLISPEEELRGENMIRKEAGKC